MRIIGYEAKRDRNGAVELELRLLVEPRDGDPSKYISDLQTLTQAGVPIVMSVVPDPNSLEAVQFVEEYVRRRTLPGTVEFTMTVDGERFDCPAKPSAPPAPPPDEWKDPNA